MDFLNRHEERVRLDRLMSREGGALAILYGRRRVGKSRLLIEWSKKHQGLYWVGEESSAAVQRKYFSDVLNHIFPGFSDVEYPNWASLFHAISREAKAKSWSGPLILDELPYLIKASPALPSVLQHWIDAEKRDGELKVALVGSSQQMMSDVALNSNSPLFGRSDELMKLNPILPGYMKQAFKNLSPVQLFVCYHLWGGIPRYWELAAAFGKDWEGALDDMVLSPLGVLHDEADRLLREEYPSAIHLRPVLDAIGMGAHKLSEIAGRLGLPATSLSKSIGILIMLGVVSKEIPFGSDEKTSKKSLYKLSDPFLRLWFKVIAPNRSALNVLPPKGRLQLYRSQESTLMSMSFEEICLMSVPYLSGLGQTFIKAGRYWGANEPEWDIVAESLDKKTILIGECKCFEKSINEQKANREFEQLKEKGRPKVLSQYGGKFCYVLFVLRSKVVSSDLPEDCIVITIEDVLAALVYEVE